MTFYYYILVSIVGIVWGIVIAARAKKAEGVVYGALDKVGIATNILLIPVYFVMMMFCGALSLLSFHPRSGGFIEILGWLVAFIGSTGPLFCGLGLGKSIALRKKGKSKLSFLVQFAGVAGLGVTFLFCIIFYGNLFALLN